MVISSYHPIVGGAEKQVAQLASLMMKEGHSVTVVTRRYPGLDRTETIDGISVVRVAVRKPFGSVGFILGAAAAIRKLRPDVVHCHSLFSPALAGALVQRLSGIPFLVKPMCGGEATTVSEKPLGRQRLSYIGGAVNTFLAVSHEIEEELVHLGIPTRKIRFIPNGVDGSRFHPAATALEKAALRKTLGLPAYLLFLFAGRMAAQKRLPLMLEAWRSVIAQFPKAKLLIAGANRSSSSEFQATFGEAEGIPDALLDQPGVQLLGHVDDMPTLLRACDVFVLPSAREGLSNALLEASATGLATVSARIGGAQDFIVEGENGLQFPVDDRDGLAAALLSLAQDAELRAALGAAARRTVLIDYDIRQTAARLLREYQTLLTGDRHHPTDARRIGNV